MRAAIRRFWRAYLVPGQDRGVQPACRDFPSSLYHRAGAGQSMVENMVFSCSSSVAPSLSKLTFTIIFPHL